MNRPKVRVSRALGIPLTAKAARIMEHRPTTPGQHGLSRKRSPSVFKTQLMEKQRLKATYNISEKQLKRYFKEAQRSSENTGDVLLSLLESRVDLAIFRMGFANTIYAAQQYVSHGHFNVNNRRTNTPSQRLKPDSVVSIREKSKNQPQILDALTHSHSVQVPEYYEINKVKMEGRLVAPPQREQIPVSIKEQLVVEYYSR